MGGVRVSDSIKYRTVDNEIYKLCVSCMEYKPLNNEYFPINKHSKDGFHTYCKTCANRRNRKWVKNNPEKRRESVKKYNAKPDRKIIVYEANKRRREDGEYREWQRNNKDKIRQYNYFRRMHKSHDITDNEWDSCKEYFNNSCAYCGMTEEVAKEKYGHVLHKEHVDHEGANDLSNCVPACKMCNSSKYTFPLNEWYNEENPDYSKERLNKIYRWLENDYKFHIDKNNLI